MNIDIIVNRTSFFFIDLQFCHSIPFVATMDIRVMIIVSLTWNIPNVNNKNHF